MWLVGGTGSGNTPNSMSSELNMNETTLIPFMVCSQPQWLRFLRFLDPFGRRKN